MDERSEQESEIFIAVQDGVGIGPVSPPTSTAAERHYPPSKLSDCSSLEELL